MPEIQKDYMDDFLEFMGLNGEGEFLHDAIASPFKAADMVIAGVVLKNSRITTAHPPGRFPGECGDKHSLV